MKQFNKSKLCALVTTAAVFMSNTAVLPSINAFAADGDAKTAKITLTDNWSKTLTYEDIPQAEEKTTTVTLEQNWSGTIDFTGVDTVNGEYRQLSGDGYSFNSWDVDIASAIKANGIELPEYPTITINDIKISYNWAFTPADNTTTTNGEFCFGASGDDTSGEWTDGEDNIIEINKNSGNGTISYSDLTGTTNIVQPRGMWLGGTSVFSKNAGDSFVVNVTSVELDVTCFVGESGGYKGLYDDATQSGNWHFAAHSPNEDAGDRSADIVAALKAETGDETAHWAIQITDMTVDYSWELTTTRVSDNYNIDFNPNPMGMTPAGSETWVEAGIQNGNYTLLEAKSGTGSVKASDVMAKSGFTVEDIHCMDINGGMWTDNPNDELTINVTGITLNVKYTIEKPPVEVYVPYEEVQDMQYIIISGEIVPIDECPHDNHIGDDGIDHGNGLTYCAWPEISMNKVGTDGNWSDGYYNRWSTNNNVVTQNGSSISFMFPISDINDAVGKLSAGEKYVISTDTLKNVEYEFLASQPDMIFGTGSYESGKIEEAMEWDPETNSDVPTGIPNITPTIAVYENNTANAVSFKGYEAIKIDYTAKSPEACYGVLVVLHGWEDNSTGWMEKFYPIDKSGSIVIDLSSMQDKVFHNVFVGPVAPANSKIGDDFAPGFAVTSAKMVTSYDGIFTAEIAKPVPNKPIIPTPNPAPSPSTPSSTPTTPSTTTPETTEKAEVVVENAIEDAKENTTVKINIKTEDTKIKAEIFLEAKDKEITLEITLDNGVTWKIESDSISEDAVDVDIDVNINTRNVPRKEVEKISEGNETMQLSLAHNGEFGFKASLDIPVEKKHNGKVANLFHYKNDKEFEFMASAKVKNGKATLPFTHASEYVVVFADEAMGEDVSSAAEIYSDSTTIFDADSNSADVKVYVIAFAALAFAGFAVARKIKQN